MIIIKADNFLLQESEKFIAGLFQTIDKPFYVFYRILYALKCQSS